jgi:hypothetical protein
MSAASKDTRLVLGGSPRVHLLPPEVGDRKRGASIRRAVVMSVVGALVISGAGYAYASWLAIEATARYDVARGETTALLAEQGKYSDLRNLRTAQQTLTDARQVGALTEIDWDAFYSRIVPTLPAGMTVTSFVIDSGSPTEETVVSAVPGVSSGVAKVTFVANTTSLATAQAWVSSLKALPEYGGSNISSITRDDAGQIAVTVEMILTDEALSKRFQPEPEPTADVSVAPAVEGAN